jgi:glutamate racemase
VSENQKIFLQNAPIGVFDSGIGGLTVLKALRARFPSEKYIYLGDTARLPYGTKSPETVARYAASLTQHLITEGVKAIVIACNTASTHGLAAVKDLAGEIPVIGMIDPAALAALAATKNGHIGVMATFGTIKSGAYTKTLLKVRPDCKISPMACQMLVALAEEGWVEGDIPRSVIHRYLDPIFNQAQPPDTLILGCTHFPVFTALLKNILGPDITLINSGESASMTLSDYLEEKPNRAVLGSTRFLVTDDPSRFAENALKFYDTSLKAEDITLIDIKG